MGLAERAKRRVAVLGATGLVGQRLVGRLIEHPWFELVALGGSPHRAGTPYGEAIAPRAEGMPPWLARMPLRPCAPGSDFACNLVFSALPAGAASGIEPAFARAGYAVVSNARAHRMESDVPLVLPEVNCDHLRLIATQRRARGWSGCIVTNPNCATSALTLALAPLAGAFGVAAAQVTTLQALSGAGAHGPGALAMLDNVLPFIAGEEEKLESEPRKLLGAFTSDGIAPADVRISAQCNRVATAHGHLECVAVKLERSASRDELLDAWATWRPLAQAGLELPSAPRQPVVYAPEEDRPQPRHDRDRESGMVTTVGRLREDPLLDFKFVALGHNLERGAAGGTVLLAELLHATGALPR
jgi:aspartate-semialdehyde dehydrogenase